MLIFDAHLDLAMNALEWNRDLTRPIAEIREREQDLTDRPDRGRGTVSFQEMRRGGVGLCVATLIARYSFPGHPMPGWRSQEQAWAQIQGQLAWYRTMEESGRLQMIRTAADLRAVRDAWIAAPEGPQPIGYALSLECADAILSMRHLERLYESGLRAIGPAHYGPGVYAQGTDWKGGLGAQGRELLREMDRLGMVLDASHLCDDSFWEALEVFQGPVWASHSNCRSLTPHNRQFNDEQLKRLIERGAVIGAVLDAWMLVPNWKRGESTPESTGVSLSAVIDHIDHVCQLAGDSEHAGIGSDLDGAFGREQCPLDLDTIADLRKIGGLLEQRGHRAQDIDNILSGNFIRFLEQTLEPSAAG